MTFLRLHSFPLPVLLLLCCSSSWQAAAQNIIPTSADPVKAAERFQRDSFARSNDNPITTPEQTAAEPSGHTGKFLLGDVKIQGMSIYPPDKFAALYQPLLGKIIGRSEIDQLTAAINEQYRRDGYALAIAYPVPQRLENGATLILQVDEGRIGTISFQGEIPDEAKLGLLHEHLEIIRTESPLTSKTLERHMLLINDLPGNTARAVLKPSTTSPGATDLVIYYVQKDYDAQLSTDNRGSKFLGPWQSAVSVASNAQLGMDERITMRSIVTSPSSELRYLDVSYLQPLNTDGTKLIAMTSYAVTSPGESLKADDVKSESVYAQLRAIHPYLRSRTQNLYLRGGMDMRNTTTDRGQANLTDDRLRNMRLGASFDRSSNQSATIVDSEFSQGIAGLGATESGDGRSNRYGDHGYTKLTLDLSHSHALSQSVSLLVTGSGQFSFNPLLSSEQFVLGGPVYGSAYEPGELAGDHGAAARAELRFGQPISDPIIRAYQWYGFYDIGSVWRRKLSGTQEPRESLSSAGFGVRAEMGQHLSANLELAIPLTRDLASDRDNRGRIYGGLTVRY